MTVEKTNKSSNAHIWLKYISPYKFHLLGALIALTIAAGSILVLGKGIGFLIDKGISHNNEYLLDLGLLSVFALVLLLAVSSFFRVYLTNYVSERAIAQIKTDLYKHIINLPCDYFEKTKTGDLLSRINNDSSVIQTILTSSFSVACRNLILLVGGLVMMVANNYKLASIVAVVIILVVMPLVFLGRKVRKLSKIVQEHNSDINSHLSETIQGIKTVKTFNYEDVVINKFNQIIKETLNAINDKLLNKSILTSTVIAFVFGSIAFVLWIGGNQVISGKISSGDLTAFIFYSIMVAGSFGSLSEVAGDIQRAMGAAERLSELMNEKSLIEQSDLDKHINLTNNPIITFENVSFSYPNANIAALQNINFTIQSGKMVAIVGPSGSGKSTLLELVLRFYQVSEGRILIDNVPISKISSKELRNYCSMVTQDPAMFSGSILDNIKLGNPDASMEEIISATKLAVCYDFIMQLPDQFNSQIGERGVLLSGGQRQRIAIARVFLRNPKILLFDEATSALDTANEQLVKQAIESLTKDRTSIIISHRLSTIQKADLIIVMDQGQIVEMGTHQELVERNGLYASLAKLQFE